MSESIAPRSSRVSYGNGFALVARMRGVIGGGSRLPYRLEHGFACGGSYGTDKCSCLSTPSPASVLSQLPNERFKMRTTGCVHNVFRNLLEKREWPACGSSVEGTHAVFTFSRHSLSPASSLRRETILQAIEFRASGTQRLGCLLTDNTWPSPSKTRTQT